MRRGRCVPRGPIAALVFLLGSALAFAADPALITPVNRIDPAAAEWRATAEAIARRAQLAAAFEEYRHFAFRNTPLALKGTVRISADLGLSLHYTAPEERIVIVDRNGVLVRDRKGEQAAPGDPRATAANEAMLHILRLDLAALATGNELYGRREGDAWVLAVVPRAEAIRRAIGEIFVEGEAAAVRRIELRRSARQWIEIRIGEAQDANFTADERARFFR